LIKSVPYGLHDLDDDDIEAVIEVLKQGPITQGNTVTQFGEELARTVGSEFGVAVSSGTAALHLSLAVLDVGPKDEVITTPITFCATANAVLYQGAIVRFADIDEHSLNIDANQIEEQINSNTKAIIPVDFRGHPAALPEIRQLATEHDLSVIEDGSHSLGSTYSRGNSNYRCGDCSHADLATFSFHPVKHITSGEGGAVLTNNPELFLRLRSFSKHGIDRRPEMFSETDRVGPWIYDMEHLGYNYRLTEFQAALGLSQLKKLPKFKARRRQIVEYYNQNFANIEEFILPHEEESADSNFHLYVLQVNDNSYFDRYDLFKYLQHCNYAPMVHYIPVHLLSYYRNRFGFQPGDFPVSEKYYNRTISIPLYPSLTDLEVETVVTNITAFLDLKRRKITNHG